MDRFAYGVNILHPLPDQEHFKALLTGTAWSGYNPAAEQIVQQHNNME
jgi:hypothetical protein